MSNGDDWQEEEMSQNISCLFCAIVPILMFVALFLVFHYHLTWYFGLLVFFSPLVVGLLILFFYNRKAFWGVIDAASE